MGNKCSTSTDPALTMAVQSGYGSSKDQSTAAAVAAAVKDAAVAKPTIGFVACTVARDVDEVQAEFAKALPGVPLHGITSSGSLLGAGGSLGDAVGCLLIEAAEGSFATASDMGGDGAAAAAALKEKMEKPQAIFMSTVPGSEEGAIEQIEKVFGSDVPIYGGTAADNELSGAWKVFTADGASGTGISLVGVGAGVKFGASMLGPYTGTAKTAVATKAEGRRVFEIDGAPAADWVYAWLGDDVKDAYENGGLILPQTSQKPVGLKQPSGEYVSAHLAALGGAEKYVDFFTPIPEGAELTVMDSADGPATGYGATLAESYDAAKSAGGLTDPKAGLLIYCGGMAIAVGDKLDAGLAADAFKGKVGALPLLGMTCFGEQARLPEGAKNVQRNLSLGMVLFE